MKTKTVITVLLVAFILVSCAPTATVVPTKTAIFTASIPVSSATLTFSPPTQTPAPTANEIESHFIVYSASSDEKSVNTYLVNTNSGENQQITNMEYANYPSWSPDGKKIVFSSSNGLFFLNIENKKELTKIVDTANFEINPIWSPDGSRIAFISQTVETPSHYDLKIVNTDGTGLITLASNLGDFYSFSWSPDGRKLTFSQPLKDSREIVTINTDGTGLTQITNTNILAPPYASPIEPSWSPDGKKIAFVIWDLFIVNPDGTELVKLVDTKAQGFSSLSAPQWSPNGKYIACQNGSNIILVNPANRQITTITGEYSIGSFSWSPQGDKLAYFIFNGSGNVSYGSLGIEKIDLDSMQKTLLTKDLGFYPWQSLSWQP